jgi:hypothetical protein
MRRVTAPCSSTAVFVNCCVRLLLRRSSAAAAFFDCIAFFAGLLVFRADLPGRSAGRTKTLIS